MGKYNTAHLGEIQPGVEKKYTFVHLGEFPPEVTKRLLHSNEANTTNCFYGEELDTLGKEEAWRMEVKSRLF